MKIGLFILKFGFRVLYPTLCLFSILSTLSIANAAVPAIDLDNYGAVAWTTSTYSTIDTYIKVIDHDGISTDGSSHVVTVTFPDGSIHPLSYYSASSQTSASYGYWFDPQGDTPPQSGEYTFTVKDPHGNIATAVDYLIVDPLPPPDENTLTPSNTNPVNEFITATFDKVQIKKDPRGSYENYDDFDDYASIDELDPNKWIWIEGALSFVEENSNKKLQLSVNDVIGRGTSGLNFASPEVITAIRADITIVDSVSSNIPYARIAGHFFSINGADMWAQLRVHSDKIAYSVMDLYETGGTETWNLLYRGEFPIILGQTITGSIEWDGTSLKFSANQFQDTYTPAGNVGPPTNSFSKALQGRIVHKTTDNTPTFTWDPVADANRYSVRIYNKDGDQTIWRGYTGNETQYTVPPGVLLPNATYRYRIEARDAHTSFDIDNISKSPASNTDNYMFYTGGAENNSPYIELDSSGVHTWNSELVGEYLTFWIKVHDAQGVPQDIQSVSVTFPSGAEETLYYDPGQSSNILTAGIYRAVSFLPIESGTYTFTVVDKSGHIFSKTEEMTNNPIGFPDESSFTPVHNTVIGGTAVDFDWEDVPEAGFYRLEIYDDRYNRIYTFATTESMYSLPAGFLKEKTLYRYRITTRREFFDENVDNGSSSPWATSLSPTLLTTSLINGTSKPSIDMAPGDVPFGAAVVHFTNPGSGLSQYGLQFYVKVTDVDGVPENIKSVTVTFPDNTTTLKLAFDEKISPTEAKYYFMQTYNSASDIQEGTYTFTVEDFDGGSEEAADDLVVAVVDVPSNLKPLPDSTLEGKTSVISWDKVSGAAGYKVRIFDGWDGTVLWSELITDNFFSVPPGTLSPDTTYSYRVYAYKEQFEVDNYSLYPFFRSLAPRFITPVDSSKIDLMLNIIATDANGNTIDPSTISHEWLFVAPTIRGVNLGIFLYTKDGFKDLETLLAEDPSLTSAAYDFDHSSSDTFSFGKVSLENDLGMVSGDVLMYGYCYTLTDVSELKIGNVVTLNIQ